MHKVRALFRKPSQPRISCSTISIQTSLLYAENCIFVTLIQIAPAKGSLYTLKNYFRS